MTLEVQLTLDDGHRFQKKLGELIINHNFTNIVETGSGVSSIYMLQAMDDAGIDGKLHSIDPAMWYPHKIEHPKFNLIKDKSVQAIIGLYIEKGPFDVAVSDGDHEIMCQTYEYEMFWQFLKPMGVLVADDCGWNNNGAWQAFLDRHGLVEDFFGDARCVVKPFSEPVLGVEVNEFGTTFNKDAVIEFHEEWLTHCENLEKEWLAAGNKKHPIFE